MAGYKYTAVAGVARAFSLTRQTRRSYRVLGNVYEGRKRVREGLPARYIERANMLLELCDRHDVLRPGDRVLELGTGWMHWEGMVLRLFHDVEVTLFDVVDNRLWAAFQAYFHEFDQAIDEKVETGAARRERAHEALRAIQGADSFDEVYRLLDMRYVIDAAGKLDRFAADSFSLVVSSDVLEHVHRDFVPAALTGTHRLLKPGGYAIHYIDIADHFSYFVGGYSRKEYLRYSDAEWGRRFENDVQYFNRIQRPDWLAAFEQAGFEIVEEQQMLDDLGGIDIDAQYRSLSEQDRDCVNIRLVLRKPEMP
jgi:SAM-dependent methyltransferase